MDAEQAHQITKELMLAIITSDKPVAKQGDYINGVCEAYKHIYDMLVNIDSDVDV